MNWLRTVAAEILALFVDDASLALSVLLWVAVAWLAFPHLVPGGWDGIALFVGIASLVVGSALRGTGSR